MSIKNEKDMEILMDFIEDNKDFMGDGYVELLVSFVMPMLADDERSRLYALTLLYSLTNRTEFRRELLPYVS